MTRGTIIAAAFLAIGFGYISLVLLVIEPRMGFATLADYFDPGKVFAATASPAWILGDIVYIGFGVALAYLAMTSADAFLRAAGLVAAVGFPPGPIALRRVGGMVYDSPTPRRLTM